MCREKSELETKGTRGTPVRMCDSGSGSWRAEGVNGSKWERERLFLKDQEKTEVREKGSWLVDEDDCKIKEDFEACRGAAMSPHTPLCQLGFSRRNEENKSRQLKGTRTSPKRFWWYAGKEMLQAWLCRRKRANREAVWAGTHLKWVLTFLWNSKK